MPVRIIEFLDKGVYLGQLALIRYHLADPSGVADEGVAVSDYITHVLPTLVGWQSTSYTHGSIITKEVYPTQALQREFPITSGGVGLTSGDPIPGTVTWSLKWVIGPTVHLGGDAGPHIKRGGKHLGGLVEASVVGNNLSDPVTFAGYAASYWAAFAAMIADSWEPCVAHQPPTVGGVLPPVSRYSLITNVISQGLGSQVSRKPRHGD